mgnify:FL=1
MPRQAGFGRWRDADPRITESERIKVLTKPRAVPKPEPRAKTKRRRDRARANLAASMRVIVWVRDKARCRVCGVSVWPPSSVSSENPRNGHVHHLRGRNVAPENRYNPDAAVLLCQKCHRAVHDGRITLEGIEREALR